MWRPPSFAMLFDPHLRLAGVHNANRQHNDRQRTAADSPHAFELLGGFGFGHDVIIPSDDENSIRVFGAA